ncbi:MAG: chordopoxvirus fusion protein, partial [Candidatus Omnitrophica bacterium]|nr:chordopoxvirus fusion protein [Candidatus Omnitrophota bacterium]
MVKLEDVLKKFPVELKDAVISFYDFLREEYVIKREEFEELKNVVKSLIIAQEKTEERIGELAQAQKKTEERISQLTERVDQLTIRLDQLTERVDQLAQ